MGRLYASIDVGTNTLRLLIAEVEPGGRLIPIVKERVITRLGEGFDGRIKEGAADRTIQALKGFSERLSSFPVERMRVVGTSVLRRAVDGKAFVERVFKETGLRIETISGKEEAILSARGVLSVIGENGRALMFDVGGGSTEYIFYDNGVKACHSIDLGVVALAETFLTSDPPGREELEEMEGRVRGRIEELMEGVKRQGVDPSPFSGDRATLVGTAGTPTTLAAIDQAMEVYDPQRINGYRLSYSTVEGRYRRLASLPIEERREVVGLERGREDVIIPGAAIVLKTMEVFGFHDMVVSDAGLLEGLIYGLLRPYFPSCAD